MRVVLFFSIVLFCVSISYGQKIKINVTPESVTFSANGEFVHYPYKINNDEVDNVYVIWKKGYVNYGFTYKDIAKQGQKIYTIELEKVKPLSIGYVSKKIDMYKVIDKTGKISEASYSDPFVLNELRERLISYGYKNLTNIDLFDTKNEDVKLKVAGEIVEFSKNTRGGGFQVSILVNWSVYDVLEDKVVLQVKTAGYSNTESVFKKELSYALRNALNGLMTNVEFQTLAEQTTSE